MSRREVIKAYKPQVSHRNQSIPMTKHDGPINVDEMNLDSPTSPSELGKDKHMSKNLSVPMRKTSFGTYTLRTTKNNNPFEFKTKLNQIKD
jgi:hypothetical protein